MAAILRSLASDDPSPINERKRLNADKDPHIIITFGENEETAIFQDGRWNGKSPKILIFDDDFVNDNIYSGLVVEPEHRRNLHEFILGEIGVELNKKHKETLDKIDQHNKSLSDKKGLVSQADLHGISFETFLHLENTEDIDKKITTGEKAIKAKEEQELIGSRAALEELVLPEFPSGEVRQLLRSSLTDLDSTAERRMREHFDMLGPNGEAWIDSGLTILQSVDDDTCPFCAQPIAGLDLIAHYRAYFAEEYIRLKESIDLQMGELDRHHGDKARTAFERSLHEIRFGIQFWSTYCDILPADVDAEEVLGAWERLTNLVMAALASKRMSPLDQLDLDEKSITAIEIYNRHRENIVAHNHNLEESNAKIEAFRYRIMSESPEELANQLGLLFATKSRHSDGNAQLCTDYLAEESAKALTESERDLARQQLDDYRSNIFPDIQEKINAHLIKFGTEFYLDSLSSSIRRGGTTCNYNVIINESSVAIEGGVTKGGEPSFKSTLSAGDRNSLALAVFLSTLDSESDLTNCIVVLDDPINSLDDHRSYATVDAVIDIAATGAQVFVLSHNKRFLCRIWEKMKGKSCTGLELVRFETGSTIRRWEVGLDSVTEHDKRHMLFLEYLDGAVEEPRRVAQNIRFHLEAFLRVSLPQYFPPQTLLGHFVNRCKDVLDSPGEILVRGAVEELEEIVAYANRFHHDTNPSWETQEINDLELKRFVERTLGFISHH